MYYSDDGNRCHYALRAFQAGCVYKSDQKNGNGQHLGSAYARYNRSEILPQKGRLAQVGYVSQHRNRRNDRLH